MFASDNTSGIHPEILTALTAVNEGIQPSYGHDTETQRLNQTFSRIFEKEVKCFLVGTGTAANALALANLCTPYGGILCDQSCHLVTDEAAAPEFFTGGARLHMLPSADGKVHPEALEKEWGRIQERGIHSNQLQAVSVTQATERGTVYQAEELRAIGAFAKTHQLKVHMDGARFANAIATLNCSPAEITWRCGIDVLSLSGTKNGCMAAEAVVFFDPALAEGFSFRRKKTGHLFSKLRFFSSQFHAYFANDLWLKSARHANTMALEMAKKLEALQHPSVQLLFPVEANEIFLLLPPSLAEAAWKAGFSFYHWSAHMETPHPNVYRLVTHFVTTHEEVDHFVKFVAQWLA